MFPGDSIDLCGCTEIGVGFHGRKTRVGLTGGTSEGGATTTGGEEGDVVVMAVVGGRGGRDGGEGRDVDGGVFGEVVVVMLWWGVRCTDCGSGLNS